MRFRFAILAVAMTLLSGCWWVGPAFYKGDPSDAAPVRPGLYKVDQLGDGKPGRKIRITWLPDGSVQASPLKLGKGDQIDAFVMVRLTSSSRELWISQQSDNDDEKTFAYGLAQMRGDTLEWAPVIDCAPTVAIVREAGGEVEGEAMNVQDAAPISTEDSIQGIAPPASSQRMGGPVCRFKDKASLERALRAYVASNQPWPVRVRFKRIGD